MPAPSPPIPVLLDAVYDPWPTPLAAAVAAAGGRVISGLQMLLHQAFAQVEQFTGLPAPREAMACALEAFGLACRACGSRGGRSVLVWLAALSCYDVRQRRLPNLLTLPGAAVILLAATVAGRGLPALAGAAALAGAVSAGAPGRAGGDGGRRRQAGDRSGRAGRLLRRRGVVPGGAGRAAADRGCGVWSGWLRGVRTVPHGPSMCLATAGRGRPGVCAAIAASESRPTRSDFESSSPRGPTWEDGQVLRWITAGESHGRALVAMVEGMVAGVEVTSTEIADQLARRRLGYGRGARMKFERDAVTVLSGMRHGVTLGGPIAIEIGNTEWPKWETVMAADPVDPAELEDSARNAPLTRPRPGHADYAGMLKYGFDDARPVLERASARETAARVAAGTVARSFLRQALGVEVLSHVIAIGPSAPYDGPPPGPDDLAAIDASPVRAFDKTAEKSMIAEIEAAKKDGDTLGGVVEVVALGLPVGLGSFTSGDNRLDSQLAAAVMGIQAIKGVEIGDGFETARRRGSRAHDEMYPGPDGVVRSTNRAGGLEGGMTNGQPLRVRAAMKPISTVPRALATVDMATGDEAVAIHQRSDVCAVPAAGVVVETMVALVLARAALEKFGGDSLTETRRNIESYQRAVADRESPAARMSG